MSFVATFEDRPRNGPRPRTFVAANVPERIWFTPERRIVDRKTITHDGWMPVGTAPPDEPWPGQIEFVLDSIARTSEPPTAPLAPSLPLGDVSLERRVVT